MSGSSDEEVLGNLLQENKTHENNESSSDTSLEDETIHDIESPKRKKGQSKKDKQDDDTTVSDSDDFKDNPKEKTKTTKAKLIDANNNKLKKTDITIERWKKYIRAAGLHINNYQKFFDDCKNEKQKIAKLKNFLAQTFKEMHMSSENISLKKCLKLKKKIEEAKEISELDTSNIISANGKRPRRSNVRSLYAITPPNQEEAKNENQSADLDDTHELDDKNEIKETFKRLKNIFDSEQESD